ncbi:hypothetical protein F5144DRAFT_493032, partial [Chaetomium tenue]
FPSALYVFDDVSEDVYFTDDEFPSRQCVSAKYVFYPLANASDKLLEQYPSVHHLTNRKDDPAFRAQLRRGLIALLSVLRDAAYALCREHGLRIVRIGLTIPVQWDLEFEAVYRSLVMEVFDMPNAGQIHFFTETEALSRYLYKHHGHELDPGNQHNAVLFLDFGGHNMNGCLFGVAHDHDRPDGNGFFRVGSPFGKAHANLYCHLPPLLISRPLCRCWRRIRAVGIPRRPVVFRPVLPRHGHKGSHTST